MVDESEADFPRAYLNEPVNASADDDDFFTVDSEPVYIDPFADKASWGDGPWQSEPDELAWSFGDVHCRIVRHPRMGNLNGYVEIPPGHPWFGKSYDDLDVDVHGGLTFAGELSWSTYATKTDRLWCLGFDCAHADDYAPGMEAGMKDIRARHPLPELPMFADEDVRWRPTYKTLEYVKTETESLARQAIDATR